ncbi:hypothetical protein ROSA5918_24185 [Roseateles saccharophilus]|uniref:Uncharacterized protein n=1 Tax=Roseateles saccharophilus TaxID=304 RepID=A0A4R3U9Z3_ROSSA|nr:hypothetical protein [Roseateles saccharophilus]TCU84180.1 hypothetical protein EV671_10546 [Roseateles saccharophilus]
MFIHAVETPRKIKVSFGIPSLGRKNQISLWPALPADRAGALAPNTTSQRPGIPMVS